MLRPSTIHPNVCSGPAIFRRSACRSRNSYLLIVVSQQIILLSFPRVVLDLTQKPAKRVLSQKEERTRDFTDSDGRWPSVLGDTVGSQVLSQEMDEKRNLNA